MTKKLLAIAAAALAFAAGSASAEQFLDFSVSESAIPGISKPKNFSADKLNGGYTEYLTATGPGTFSSTAVATFAAFFSNEGTKFVTGTGLGGQYLIYALFSAKGNVDAGFTKFTGTSGEFKLYMDPNVDTTFGTSDGVAPISVGLDTDDYLLASTSTLVNGFGDTFGPPGAFDFIFDKFTLSAAGAQYFVAPNPFHFRVNVNGDIDQFQPGQTSVITGDVSAVFKVPEPGSLALVGLALAGLGLARRRKA